MASVFQICYRCRNRLVSLAAIVTAAHWLFHVAAFAGVAGAACH
jgi:hypothetical protein